MRLPVRPGMFSGDLSSSSAFDPIIDLSKCSGRMDSLSKYSWHTFRVLFRWAIFSEVLINQNLDVASNECEANLKVSQCS